MKKINLFFLETIGIFLYILGILEYINLKNKKVYSKYGIIILSLLIFSTNQDVPDYFMYERFYNSGINNGLEVGYIVFQNVFRYINFDFKIFRVFIGVITILLLYNSFYKLVKYPNMAIVIYYSYQFLEKPYIQIRNALSIAIFLNISKYLIEDKKLKSIIGIFFSALFHISGYFYILIIILQKIFLKNKRRLKIIVIFSLVCSVILVNINLENYLKFIINLNLGRISERVNTYFFSEEGKKYIGSTKIGIRLYFSLVVYFLYSIKLLKNKVTTKDKFIFSSFCFLILFKLISYKIIIFNRMTGVFDYAEVLGLVRIVELEKNKNKKILYIVTIFFYMILSVYIVYKNLNN